MRHTDLGATPTTTAATRGAPAPRLLDRRTFLADLGHGAIALAIVGIAGCAPSGSTAAPTLGATPGGAASPGESGGAGGATPPATAEPATGAPDSPAGDVRWQRVNLGFVSAYLLVRGGEAALVDTGVAGSEGGIEDSLAAIGLDWGAVAHVILTHHHNDHQGSLRAVQERAPEAATWAGAEDVASLVTDRAVTAVADGDTVFDLRIVTAPGHTAGSICVHEPILGILVTGDALRTEGGKPALPGAEFTADMDKAKRSVAKLGGLAFETLLPGHGDPIERGAAALVAELAASG